MERIRHSGEKDYKTPVQRVKSAKASKLPIKRENSKEKIKNSRNRDS